ncbi:ImmA/IrrE family metallo-endopeptidase [Deinococcus maricopensis]|uniref:IrrE N-terminal-like domain-containing protein n=1 Tax=Deinococcus maricopensis (strain DSM 21211 / LMG 22137 / NRRL B-23946 / LB-34) TaxID=709986 RepID=E8U6A1_DEIML|nr:ImmA/IrrE family metallo-endopeptidase [Deinococcus maricopensis]ADV66590.1 protein of unknown function DUF955 [Deinococcus maricopensis DSM 21211]
MTHDADGLAPHKARMRELARAYADAAPSRDAHGLTDPLGAKLVYMDLGDRDGAYDPEHGVILVNSKVQPGRQRFTLAHEISHALLLADDDLLSALHDEYDGDRLEQVIETLCNVGAAAILMPHELLTELLTRFGATGRAVAELARRADVSVSTAMYALAECVTDRVLFAVAVAAGGRLTVRASAATDGVKYTLSNGTAIPDDHPIHDAHATHLEITARSYVPFRSGRRLPARVNAYPLRGRVVASFTLDQPAPPDGTTPGSDA